jgi:hypothetical protein
MKKHILLVFAFAILQSAAFGQLTLKKVGSTKTVKVKNGTYLSLKLPTTTELPDSCDCFNAYSGELMSAAKDKIELQVANTNRVYRDVDGINKNVYTILSYPSTKVTSSISLKNPLSLTTGNSNNSVLNNFAAVLLCVSVVDALVVNPFLSKNAQKNNNKFMWAAFGVGLTLAILPKTKTYHFQQPKKGGKKTLWQLVTP